MEEWLQSIGISNATENYADILSNLDIEFVRLLRHKQKLLLRQQKQGSLFCGKPVSLDIQEIKKAIDAINVSGVKMEVGFMRRFASI